MNQHSIALACFSGLLFLLTCIPIPAQTVDSEADATAEEAASQRAAAQQILAPSLPIALSTPDYPVTPGDTYSLVYATFEGTVITTLVVSGDYRINLGVFGTIDVADLTYVEARSAMERRVANAFPQSSPSVALSAVGSFRVLVRGAVRQTERVGVWGLTRLSQLLDGRMEPYSSQRRVQVTSVDGVSATYDLLRARLFGDVDQDPRLKPGDTVTVDRAKRTVRLEGEVYRPGIYDLLESDDLGTLIEDIGRGTLPIADRSRVEVRSRYGQGVRWISLDAEGREVVLEHGDIVEVPNISRRAITVTVEGGIGQGVPVNFGIVEVSYTEGMTAFEALVDVREELSPYADLTSVAVVPSRGSEDSSRVFVDFAGLLRSYSPSRDVVLEPFDRLIVTAVQPQILVYGAVNSPGLQPLAPNQTAKYYIRRAGGFDSDRNSGDRFTVFDQQGNEREPHAVLEADDSILAHSNSFLYSFNRFFPVLASTLSFASAIISFMSLFAD